MSNTATFVDENEPVSALTETATVTVDGECVCLTLGVPGGPKKTMTLDAAGAKALGTQLIRASTKIEGCTEQIAILVMTRSQLARMQADEDEDQPS